MIEFVWEMNDVLFCFVDLVYFIVVCVVVVFIIFCVFFIAFAVIVAVALSIVASVAVFMVKLMRWCRFGMFCKKVCCSVCLILVEEDFKFIDGIVVSVFFAFGEVTLKVGESVFLVLKMLLKFCVCVDLFIEVGFMCCGCVCI